MKRLFISTALVAATVVAAPAFAIDSFGGNVVSMEGEGVTVQAGGPLPSWIREGAKVQAMGGTATVLAVKGSAVVLKFTPGAASRVKSGAQMTIREARQRESC